MNKVNFLKSGLTLFEVMIALAIFAVAAIVALQTCFISTRHIQIVNDEKNLVILSKIKLEEEKLKVDIDKEKSGTFPFPFEGYHWEFELTDIAITDTEYGMIFFPYKLTVKTKGSEYSTLTCFFKINQLDRSK